MRGRKRGAFLLEKFRTEILPQVPGAEFWAVCEEPIEGPGVKWFGRVPFEKLVELYRAAWAFCLPSTYEGFGIPYIEAMASGTSVVASPNLGAREVLADGRFGIVAEDAQLGPAIVRLLQDEAARTEQEKVGLRRAQEYSWDRVCGAYEQLYRGEAITPFTPVPA